MPAMIYLSEVEDKDCFPLFNTEKYISIPQVDSILPQM